VWFVVYSGIYPLKIVNSIFLEYFFSEDRPLVTPESCLRDTRYSGFKGVLGRKRLALRHTGTTCQDEQEGYSAPLACVFENC
jgi:hypothetical protein